MKDFKIAEQMIDRLIVEDAFLNLYQGEKEVIVTGELFGVEWKGKIDCLNLEDDYFVDIKQVKIFMKENGMRFTVNGAPSLRILGTSCRWLFIANYSNNNTVKISFL